MGGVPQTSSYDIVEEARIFMQQYEDEEWEPNDEAKTFVVFHGEKKEYKTDMPNRMATVFTDFRAAMNNLNLVHQMPHADSSTRVVTLVAAKLAAEAVVNVKHLLRAHKLTKPGPAYHKKLKELEDQVKQLEDDKKGCTKTLQSVTLGYDRLKNRIKRDMGEVDGHRYIQNAIADSDDNAWESDVTADNMDEDKHE